jgi:hypothetical protein
MATMADILEALAILEDKNTNPKDTEAAKETLKEAAPEDVKKAREERGSRQGEMQKGGIVKKYCNISPRPVRR